MAGQSLQGLFEEHIDIDRGEAKEAREKRGFIKRYGKHIAIVSFPIVAAATYVGLSLGKGKETKITGEKLNNALKRPGYTEVIKTGSGYSSDNFKASYSGTKIPDKKDEINVKYADWDWDPKELPIETARKVFIRDFGFSEDFKILRMNRVRDNEKLKRIKTYFERMGYDMKMVYHITYSEHNEWHAIFYADGEWGGMPYFKQKWEESKR